MCLGFQAQRCYFVNNNNISDVIRTTMDDLEPSIEYSDTGYPVAEPVPIFAVSLRPPNKIRLINVGPDLVRAIQVRYFY